MPKSNHTVTLSREELEELERKAEIAEDIIKSVQMMVQNNMIQLREERLVEVEMNKGELVKLINGKVWGPRQFPVKEEDTIRIRLV